jgi:UV DNA damage endonuclease
MRLPRSEQLERLLGICLHNAAALRKAITFCAETGIGAFRVNSQILPLKTHPEIGYDIAELPAFDRVIKSFRDCGEYARLHDVRLSFHPDQFVVLNSPNQLTVNRSIAELEYQAEVACWIGADTINIHAGGAYGDKVCALKTLRSTIEGLGAPVRSRLTLENDDKVFTPADLVGVCSDLELPLVYDVHHHRCLPDAWTVEMASDMAVSTWRREPLFHISSPLLGWQGQAPQRHHDYISPRDFPEHWKGQRLTVEIEAKAKELAVLKLMRDLDINLGNS